MLAPPAWNTATGAGVGVAVIDTGHRRRPRRLHRRARAPRASSPRWSRAPDATTPNDDYGHGTHVAGIIAGDGTRRPAGDPLAGKYVGIAPDANLIAIKASDDEGDGTILDAIYGLQFAVDHKTAYNIRVVNLSVASTVAESYRTDPLDAAVEAAYFNGILVVAAAGNRGTRRGRDRTTRPRNDPFAFTVGAVDDQGTTQRGDDVIASWSSIGPTQDGFAKPEIAAPGAHIVSTLAPGSDFDALCPQCIVDGSYLQIGGTSMAAPVVAGVAALIVRGAPRLDAGPDQVHADRDRPQPLDGGVDEVNAAAALGGHRAVVRRERRSHPERPARRQRQHRLGPLELGPLELGPDRGSAGRRLGELELRVHLPGLERRGNGIDPVRAGAARPGS